MEEYNNTDYKKIWDECLDILKDIVDARDFQFWFGDITPISFRDNTLTLGVRDSYYYEYIEAHFLNELRTTIGRVIGPKAKLRYSVAIADSNLDLPSNPGHLTENPLRPAPVSIGDGEFNPFVFPGIKKVKVNSQLNENYSFENFIEGSCNALAVSAGHAVAQNPGKTSFNPFFIYSNVGLGKTHLAHAIGLETKKNNPDKVVLYLSASEFSRQFVDASKNGSINDFLHFYSLTIDVLIIDDIQQIMNKRGTQDTFFEIFNNLHQNNKQIIITSDKAPSEIEGMDERVLSRLKWGLSASLQVPDVKTRIAIIKKKLENDGGVIRIPDEVIEYMAYSITTSIRDLEGALVSLQARTTYDKREVDMEMARSIVDSLVKSNTREITIDYIQKIVCDYYNVTVDQMLSSSRKSNIVSARHICMFLARKLTKYPLVTIGEKCGKKDHATVLHACKSVTTQMETEPGFSKCIRDIEKKIIG